MKNSNATVISSDTVKHIAHLANIPVSEAEEKKLAAGFTTTLKVVDQLNTIDISKVEPTSQVTGLSNVFREDTVDDKNMLTQKQALSNAKKTHNGYFVVDQILEQSEA
jgi:aspartyl-tRNA(Asn)/glutamyl-tRNA(Gln) amidotransferase subunit C